MSDKYPFDLSFQEQIIRFVLNNPDGFEAMSVIKSSYFDDLYHSLIFHGIQTFYTKNGRVPSKAFLRNTIPEILSMPDFSDALTLDEENKVLQMVEKLYGDPSEDGDLILEALYKFSSHVELKNLQQSTDFDNIAGYENYARKVNEIISKGDYKAQKKAGVFLVQGIKERQMKRQASDLVVPTPYHQLNALSSAGGFEPGSVMVILDRPKKLKTAFLVNTARKYMASKMKVLYIDLENGENSISARLEQSVGRVSKKDIIKGTKDKDIQKILRRYKRLGGEVFIKRLPAFSTVNDIQNIVDLHYRKYGILYGAIMIDYLALMGSLSGKKDDFDRISDAYLDVANFMQKNPSITHCWTANHVVRNAKKRESSRYSEDDIAKCIDIVRHAQGIYGLNRTRTEFENNIVRLEIVMQREGVPIGRAYFRAFPEFQRMDELTKREIEELRSQGILFEVEDNEEAEEPSDRPGDI
jgi:KaiC/GvpD/RAD55 family RecA-like ATPase